MEHTEFRIGLEFWCGDQRWRCTDVGIRVIVAISLEPHEVVTVHGLGPAIAGPPNQTRHVTDDPCWLNGPPYAVAESVFDEYDLGGCSLEQEDDVDVAMAGTQAESINQ
jgi:hypothetical protein